MFNFILKKVLNGVLILLGVATVVFWIFKILPGDPARALCGQRCDEATLNSIRIENNLNKPVATQFLLFINDLSPLSIHDDNKETLKKYNGSKLLSFTKENALFIKAPYLGKSMATKRDVSDIISDRFPSTAWLALAAMVFATIVGVFFGVIAALKQNSFLDRFLVSFSILGISIPSFVSAVLIGLLFAVLLREYTGLNLFGSLYETHAFSGRSLNLKNLILPAFTLGIRPLAIIVQLTRSSMLDALKEDYIRTAKSKGLSNNVILFKHALRNALNPVITAVSGWFAGLLAGAFFIEKVFSWKGLGLETINAVFNSDAPVVIGSTLFIGLVFIIISILVDILYALLDPRVRLQ